MIKHPLQVTNMVVIVPTDDPTVSLLRTLGPYGFSRMTRPNSGKRTREKLSHSPR